MNRGHALMVMLGFATMACRPPPEAPEELNELTRYLYANWEDDDPRVLEGGMASLESFLADVDLDAGVLGRSWEVEPLFEEDVAEVERPDRALEDLLGVAVAYRSRWPVRDHARVQSEPDQTPFEPTAKEHYDRFFPELDDSSCVVERDCTVMRTRNEATRKNVLMEVTFELFKDFRWVALEDERWALLSRSWFAEPFEGKKDSTTLWQSFAIDVWIGHGDETVRFQSVWSESDLGIAIADRDVIATIKAGTDSIFAAGDDAIGEVYHGE